MEITLPCGCKFESTDGKIHFDHDIHSMNLECKETWDIIGSGDTKGIFQFESRLGQRYAKKLKPKCINDLAALNALLRPGCISGEVDVLLDIDHRKRTKRMPIKDLYATYSPHKTKLISLDENHQFVSNTISEVINQGKKRVYKVIFKRNMRNNRPNNRYNLVCTDDHPLLTPDGWKRVDQLKSGDRFAIYKYTSSNPIKHGNRIDYREICYQNYYYRCVLCDWDSGSLDVNHLYDRSKHTHENLSFLCPNHHRMYTEGTLRNYEVYKAAQQYKLPHSDDIMWAEFIDLECQGFRYTYDIILQNAPHNFVAGNVVVHNCMEVKIDDVSITDHFVKRHHGEEDVDYLHPALEDILKDTHGLLIFQEQAIKIAKEIAGFNLQEADKLRKCVARGSMVYTNEGHQRIESLTYRPAGSVSILTMHNNQLIYAPLKRVWHSGNQHCVRVRTDDGKSIVVTPDHRIWTENGWVEAQDLSLNSKVMTTDSKLCSGKFVKVNRVSTVAMRETYDFEVDHPVAHHGFINGILVHNSVGKKLADLMIELEKGFIDGCKKTGKVDEETAKTLFEQIRASQRYAFNKCLDPENTWVQTELGKIRLAYIRKGDKVLAPSSTFKKHEYVEVTDVIENGYQELYSVTLENEINIRCTYQHRFLCGDGEIRPLYEIISGDYPIMCHINKECVPSRLKNVISIGQRKTVNITVDNSHHLFYANNFVTSNSHSVGYALNAYRIAYAKAHVTPSFFTSSLYYAKDKQGTFDEIKLLVNNAKLMGISVLNPDLRYSTKRFARNDPNHPNRIYFGLGNIRGIGDKVIGKLTNAIHETEVVLQKKRGAWRWIDFLLFCSTQLSSSVVEGLIRAGALDYMGETRTKMLFEYKKFRTLTTKELVWMKTNVDFDEHKNLVDIVGHCLGIHERGLKGPCHNKNRVKILGDIYDALRSPPYSMSDSVEWLYRTEEAVLGIAISCSMIDGKVNTSMANCNCLNFIKGRCGTKDLFIAATITEIKEHVTKNGKDMAFIELEDSTGSISGVIFPDDWESIRMGGVCIVENGVMVNGYKSREGDSLIVQKMWQLN